MNVTLYSRPGCHLCESAQDALDALRRQYPHVLQVVDITTDRGLLERYGERIPVVVVDGHEYAAPLSPQSLERALRSARR